MTVSVPYGERRREHCKKKKKVGRYGKQQRTESGNIACIVFSTEKYRAKQCNEINIRMRAQLTVGKKKTPIGKNTRNDQEQSKRTVMREMWRQFMRP